MGSIVGTPLSNAGGSGCGTKIRQSKRAQGQEGRARDEARQAEERTFRRQGQESQAGNRHRAVGSTPVRSESAQEEKIGRTQEEELSQEKIAPSVLNQRAACACGAADALRSPRTFMVARHNCRR